ncbi:iron complex transport system substrate-binding protein [Streptomyces sp. 3330]|uniref:iron-siderophore ABC transporter substrate-binding protein n=1 Tax=Streptomyces sp. 3330 TaxID=2817755 RepID=UPI00285B1D53|nr:iron-siderophore ABC transporter substrate-binding protein [Streptomyces sp. 3330]MDR6977740.1 iron complex transport system substrate-binding protein [Streptomyces sp. 3330]
MPRATRASRLSGLLASVVLLAVAAVGCGGSDSGSSSSGAKGPDPSSAAGAFPVTLDHKYGRTTIGSEPQRIVTVGLTDQDAVLALGKVPVGTTEWLGGYRGAVGPWAQDKLGGAAAPAVLTDTGTGPQVEKIAALKPDLILALYSGLTEAQYESLSKFAPVLAQPKAYNDYGVPWQQQTEEIGKALGKEAEAKALVSDVEDEFAAARKAHPAFAGATAVMATPYEGTFVYGSQDTRSRILSGLGFSLPKDLDKVIGDTFGANISKERFDLLDQDVAVWILPDLTTAVAKLHGDKIYADLNVVKQGREVFVRETGDYGNAVSLSTVLSLPYVLDRLVPQLAAAVDGRTATEVKQPAS